MKFSLPFQLSCSSLAPALFVLGPCDSLDAQEELTSAQFDPLYQAWLDAPPGTQQATAQTKLQAFVREFLGGQTVDGYLYYVTADSVSEQQAQQHLQLVKNAMARHGVRVRWVRAEFMLSTYFHSVHRAAHRAAVGEPTEPDAAAAEPAGRESGHSHEIADVELHIEPYQAYIVGQDLIVNGSIHNHSKDSYLYLNASTSMLHLPSALASAGRWSQVMEAEFPGKPMRDSLDPDIVILAPGSELRLTWRARRTRSEVDAAGVAAALGWLGDLARLESHEYKVDAELWYATNARAARRDDRRGWTPISEAYPNAITVRWSFIFLLPALWSGGVLVLLAQVIYGSTETAPKSRLRKQKLGIGLAGAVVLTTLVAVLSFAFGEAPLLPSIKMDGLMEAFAAGMVIQFLGYRYFAERFTRALESGGNMHKRISSKMKRANLE